MSKLTFDDRVAVVTGGGRGLGRAYALMLAARGARVVVNDIGGALDGSGCDDGPATAVVREIEAAGGQAIACTASVATPEGGREIVGAAMDAWGRIDILIHNAGNVRYGSLTEVKYEDVEAVLDVHLLGAFNVVRPAFQSMSAADYGRIVLTSSIGGLYGNHDVVNYAMAKAGIIGVNKVVAIEGAAHGVKCNVIVPGALTRMAEGLDVTRYPAMEPTLVAPVVGWLSHEQCSITGEMLVSIAGRIARAFIGESKGLSRKAWTIEEVAENVHRIMDVDDPLIFGLDGHAEHIQYSFDMAKRDQ